MPPIKLSQTSALSHWQCLGSGALLVYSLLSLFPGEAQWERRDEASLKVPLPAAQFDHLLIQSANAWEHHGRNDEIAGGPGQLSFPVVSLTARKNDRCVPQMRRLWTETAVISITRTRVEAKLGRVVAVSGFILPF